jgi:hypothetical protein
MTPLQREIHDKNEARDLYILAYGGERGFAKMWSNHMKLSRDTRHCLSAFEAMLVPSLGDEPIRGLLKWLRESDKQWKKRTTRRK